MLKPSPAIAAAFILALSATAAHAGQYLQVGGHLNIITDSDVDPGFVGDLRGGYAQDRFAVEFESSYSYNAAEIIGIDVDVTTYSVGGNVRYQAWRGLELALGGGYSFSEGETDFGSIEDDGLYGKGEVAYVVKTGQVELVPALQAVWIDPIDEWTIRAGMGVRLGP